MSLIEIYVRISSAYDKAATFASNYVYGEEYSGHRKILETLFLIISFPVVYLFYKANGDIVFFQIMSLIILWGLIRNAWIFYKERNT